MSREPSRPTHFTLSGLCRPCRGPLSGVNLDQNEESFLQKGSLDESTYFKLFPDSKREILRAESFFSAKQTLPLIDLLT